MRRLGFITIAAFALLIVALIGLKVFEPRTIAKDTFQVHGETIDVRIEKSNGQLVLSARQRKAWSNGWESTRGLGDASDIGIHDPKLTFVPDSNTVLVQVGRRAWSFDPQTHDLHSIKP